MNRLIACACLFALLISMGGCKHEQATSTICLLDVSKSIDPNSIRDEFAAMDRLVDRMHRGDRLILIPITGNARNDVQGHIVRLVAPDRRAAFDSDLTAFRKQAHEEIGRMKDWASSHPGDRTDILGTLQIAQQEIASEPQANARLVILSDFIEDDGRWSFAKDQSLASAASARRLADTIAMQRNGPLRDIPMYLGRLKSRDRAALSASRLDAIDAFWKELLGNQRQSKSIHADGAGSL